MLCLKVARDTTDLRNRWPSPQGLRFVELLRIVREGKPGFATQTLTDRLRELQRRWQFVAQDAMTKRYVITDRGRKYLREAHPIRDVVNHAHTYLASHPLREALPSAYVAIFAQVKGCPPVSQFATGVPPVFKKLQSGQSAFLPDLASDYTNSFAARWIRMIFTPLIEGKGMLMPQLARQLQREVQRLRDGEVRDEDLDSIWRAIFPAPHRLVVAEQMDTDELLAWLKTHDGRKLLTGCTSGGEYK